MELKDVKCPSCKNRMKVKLTMKRKLCPFCGTSFKIGTS